MVLSIVLAVLFVAIVFFHYLQGFFSAAISAILAVFSAALAFSLHEWVVESFLQGKMANTAHAMVLVALFAIFYLGLRIVFDKAIPEGISLPAAIDRVGGAVMGSIAAFFALGILTIAAQELPYAASVAGYSKYETTDRSATVQVSANGQMHQGSSNSEMRDDVSGTFPESSRKQLFPIVLPGVDDMVVNTVAHLSDSGSLAGSQPLTAIHPDFLQENFGQRAGIQAGAKHVQTNFSGDPAPAVSIAGIFYLSADPIVNATDGASINGRNLLSPPFPLKQKETKEIQTGIQLMKPVMRKLYYMTAPANKMMVIIRLEFGQRAKDDEDSNIRFSPGSARMVAPKNDSGVMAPADFYPIGTLEKGWEHPTLYVNKPDDFLFVRFKQGSETKPGVDLVYVVDEKTFQKDKKIADGTFFEFKRMVREDLSRKEMKPWTPPEVKEGETFGAVHPLSIEMKPPNTDKPGD